MVGVPQPLDNQFAIVDERGMPTRYFTQWAQQRQIDIQNGITAEQAAAIIVAYLNDHPLSEGSGIDLTNLGKIPSGVTISANVQEILNALSTTQGTILFRGAAAWQALAPGTIGQVLQSGGAGADPSWGAAGGGGSAWSTVYSNVAIANPTANIDVDVRPYNDIFVLARLVTTSASAVRRIVVSVDNGATFYTTSGNYVFFDTNGGETVTDGFISHATTATAARTIAGDIMGIRLNGVPKVSREIGGGRQRAFVASTSPITHIRLQSASGNMTGGQFYVFGR